MPVNLQAPRAEDLHPVAGVQLGHVPALHHVPDGREFELGLGALGMGHAYLVGSRLAERANPVLRDLADRLDVSVALSVRDGLDMLYLAYCASQKVATLRLGAGMLLPMGVTAAGHAYLWGQPLAERQALLLHLERGAADPVRVRRSVDASFLMLDEVGVCLVAGEYQRDVYAVAVPVVVGSDRALMALSCGKAQAQADLEAERRRIAPALREASEQLELALADFDGPP